MIKNITVGSDPEFFIFKEETPVSSIGVIKGTKHRPVEVEPGYGILKDNVLIEGNIPPAKSREEFINNYTHLKQLMSEILSTKNYKLVSLDSAKFSNESLDNIEAKTFGCAPYYNAWSMDLSSPMGLEQLNHRVAGNHIHIGYEYEGELSEDFVALYVARAFDYFVVYPSRQIHNDPIRAKYYGDYGNFRIKEYGVECRSLGGYFTQDKYLGWIYDQVIKTMEFCSNPYNMELLDQVGSPEYDAEGNYNFLNINLEEQLNGINTNTVSTLVPIKKAV